MGYIKHDAIVVTSYNRELLAEVHTMAVSLGMCVSPVSEVVTNMYASFAVFPDGSKEGWDRSADGDAERGALVDFMQSKAFEDGSNALDWVTIRWGGDDAITEVDSQRARYRGDDEDEEEAGNE